MRTPRRPKTTVTFPEHADWITRADQPVAEVFERLPEFVAEFTADDEREGVLRCALCGHRARLKHPNRTRGHVAPAEVSSAVRTTAKHVSAKHRYGDTPVTVAAAWDWLIKRGYVL